VVTLVRDSVDRHIFTTVHQSDLFCNQLRKAFSPNFPTQQKAESTSTIFLEEQTQAKTWQDGRDNHIPTTNTQASLQDRLNPRDGIGIEVIAATIEPLA